MNLGATCDERTDLKAKRNAHLGWCLELVSVLLLPPSLLQDAPSSRVVLRMSRLMREIDDLVSQTFAVPS